MLLISTSIHQCYRHCCYYHHSIFLRVVLVSLGTTLEVVVDTSQIERLYPSGNEHGLLSRLQVR